ncbi:MAG: hypothetical protein LBU60_00490 [Clostridiales bacterium]|jgi:hypothetical protein|nr:hypothetical protein [Clostridiales bacterium]
MKLDKNDKVNRAEKILGHKLSVAFNNAQSDREKLAAIYVFGVKWAKEFEQHSVDTQLLLQYSKIGAHHYSDLQMGILLSKYLVDKDKIKKLLSFF